MATYVNDLRLKEIATGDEAGTWGTSTNTNLELIAEAFSFGTEAITTNADTHTTTIADGSTDPGRSLFLKYTGTLDSACTITIGPNTVSKLWLIENATSGSQNIIIKQGSGATVTVPNGQTKAIYSDGAGSGGAMVDAFAHLNVVDLTVEDDLTITDDLSVGGTLGVTGVLTANAGVVVDNITIDGTEIDLSSGDLTLDVAGNILLNADGGGIYFQDASLLVGSLQNSSSDFLISAEVADKDIIFRGIDSSTTIDALTLDMSEAGAAAFNSSITSGGNITVGGTNNLIINDSGAAVFGNDGDILIGNSGVNGLISAPNGDLTFDVAGDIHLDADGGDVNFKDGGTIYGFMAKSNNDLLLGNVIADGDVLIRGNDSDGGGNFTALTLDMSDSGSATFNGRATIDPADGDADDQYALFVRNNEATAGRNYGLSVRGGSNSSDESFSVRNFDNSKTYLKVIGDGHSVIGHTASISSAGEAHELQVYDTNFSLISAATFRNGSDGASISLSHSRSGTIGTQTILQDGDTMGAINFLGSDGTDMASFGARIHAEVDGTPGSNDMPGRLIFATTPDGANGSVERMRINQKGSVGIGVADGDVTGDGTAARTYVGIIGSANRGRLNIGTTASNGADAGTLAFTNGTNSLVELVVDTHSGVQNAGDFTLDVTGDISFDADGGDFNFKDGGTTLLSLSNAGSNNVQFLTGISDGDLLFKGVDGGSVITALTLDMSEGGAATFRGNMTMNGIAGTSPILNLVNNDSEDVNTGRESSVRFNGFRSGGEAVINAQISGSHFGSADDDKGMLFFYTNNGSGIGERMRITDTEIIFNSDGNDQNFRVAGDSDSHILFADAGNDTVCFGASTPVGACNIFTYAGSTPGIQTQNLTTGLTNLVLEVRNNGASTVGTINATNTATEFNTSSDYRLKENVETLKDGLDRLNQLKPVQFTWKVDDSFSEGFIAHEVEDVFPDAVSGEKDAVDDKGEIKPQQVDYGRITPLLVKAIQEQQEQIEELKAEIAKIKGE